MVALATVLSFFQFTGPWLAGGSVTLFSMVPICLFGYLAGIKWGLLCGTVYGFIQLLLGLNAFKGVTLPVVIGAIFFDYVLAYALLGLTGIFKNKKNHTLYFTLSCEMVTFLRFLCHFLSGVFIWGSVVQNGIVAVSYSFFYNIGYMGPEMIVTAIGGFTLMHLLKHTQIFKMSSNNEKNE